MIYGPLTGRLQLGAGANGKPVLKLGGHAVKPRRGGVTRLAIEQPRLNARGALLVGVVNRGLEGIRVAVTDTVRSAHDTSRRQRRYAAARGSRPGAVRRSPSPEPEQGCTARSG